MGKCINYIVNLAVEKNKDSLYVLGLLLKRPGIIVSKRFFNISVFGCNIFETMTRALCGPAGVSYEQVNKGVIKLSSSFSKGEFEYILSTRGYTFTRGKAKATMSIDHIEFGWVLDEYFPFKFTEPGNGDKSFREYDSWINKVAVNIVYRDKITVGNGKYAKVTPYWGVAGETHSISDFIRAKFKQATDFNHVGIGRVEGIPDIDFRNISYEKSVMVGSMNNYMAATSHLVGGTWKTIKRPLEYLPINGVDINSSFPYTMLTDCFTQSCLVKWNFNKYNSRHINWQDPEVIKYMIDTADHFNQSMYVLVDIGNMNIKDINNGVNPYPEDLCFLDKEVHIGNNLFVTRASNVRYYISMRKYLDLCERYTLEDTKILGIWWAFTRKLPQGVRQVVLDSIRRAVETGSSSDKRFRNAIAGVFASTDLQKYTKEHGLICSIDKLCETMKKSHFMCKDMNLYIGAEIRHNSIRRCEDLCRYIESLGCEVVYSNVDSCYYTYDNKESFDKAREYIKEFNLTTRARLIEETSDLNNTEFLKRTGLEKTIGGLKIEHAGYMIHSGPNMIIIADSNGIIKEVKSSYGSVFMIKSLVAHFGTDNIFDMKLDRRVDIPLIDGRVYKWGLFNMEVSDNV